MKYIIIFLVIATSYLVYRAYSETYSTNIQFEMSQVEIVKSSGERIKIKVKVADAQNERAHGLMGVKALHADEGMLFIFEDERTRGMWMENTFIPLDMLFIDGNKKIIRFSENAIPLSKDIIPSIFPTKYVLEVNGGFVKKHGIAVGDKIEFGE
jgi:uncharacterized protein